MTPLRLFVLGGTGRIGTEVLSTALARGHRVTAFVRSPTKLAPRDRLAIVGGDLRDPSALAAAMTGHDAVISCLGLPPREALRPSTFMTESAASTVAAMTRAGVPRLAIVSAAVLFPGRGLVFTFFRWFLRHHARDLTTMEATVRGSDLAWTVVRPPRLVRGADATFRVTDDELPPGSTATFAAVARFLVEAAEGDRAGRVVGLSS